jgi:hypothetical protein
MNRDGDASDSGFVPAPAQAPQALPGTASSLLAKMAALDASTQASVPGLYAWALTVAPAAWSRSGSIFAKAVSLAALFALGLGILAERRLGSRGRFAAFWGFVLSCALVWIATPMALGPLRLDGARGVAGMLGWALYAFASAAPALRRDTLPAARVVSEAPLRPRTRIRRGDALHLAGAAVLAAALQLVGWGVAAPERAILVRFVALASGLALIGGATTIALARHGHHTRAAGGLRVRRALPYLVLLVIAASLLLVSLRG